MKLKKNWFVAISIILVLVILFSTILPIWLIKSPKHHIVPTEHFYVNPTTPDAHTGAGHTAVVAPTTVAPTTVAPTTVAPTTVAPTAVAPTVVAPTTVAPTAVTPIDTAKYILPLTNIIKKYKVSTIVDVACGDCSTWLPSILDSVPFVTSYIGLENDQMKIDALNKKLLKYPQAKILKGDASTFDVPKCDLILCQNVLQFMTIEGANTIVQILKKNAKNAYKLAVFETYRFGDNLAAPVNGIRNMNLDAKPFNISSANWKTKIDEKRDYSVVLFDKTLH